MKSVGGPHAAHGLDSTEIEDQKIEETHSYDCMLQKSRVPVWLDAIVSPFKYIMKVPPVKS